MPFGAQDCGNGRYCQQGTRCASHGKCIEAGVTDCNNGVFCAPGSKCWKNTCIARERVDCGSYHCGWGAKCGSQVARCIYMNEFECRGGYVCSLGSQCSSLGRCVADTAQDCGGGKICAAEEGKCGKGKTYCVPLGGQDCGTYGCSGGQKCSYGNACLAFRRSGHGLFGGVSWTLGAYALNRPTQKNRSDYKAKSADYDFIIGLAVSTNEISDVTLRAFADNLEKGRATPAIQHEYGLIRGRIFELLDCHSNGAMICLAAIRNGDVKVEQTVRLWGPQITDEAWAEWSQLAAKHGFHLEIYISDGDFVPVLSLTAGRLMAAMPWNLSPLTVGPDFAGILAGKSGAASVPTVEIFRCPIKRESQLSLQCHDAKIYAAHLNVQGADVRDVHQLYRK